MKTTRRPRPPVELRQLDPSRNRARMYRLAESSSLFGERGLMITWGRIGRAPRVRFEPIESDAALHARWSELLKRRLAHGYELVRMKQLPLLQEAA